MKIKNEYIKDLLKINTLQELKECLNFQKESKNIIIYNFKVPKYRNQFNKEILKEIEREEREYLKYINTRITFLKSRIKELKEISK